MQLQRISTLLTANAMAEIHPLISLQESQVCLLYRGPELTNRELR